MEQALVHLDTSQLEAFQSHLLGLIKTESFKAVAESHKQRILSLTESGADAFGEIFAPYVESYAKVRKGKGLGTDVKNLRVTDDMLASIELREKTLTVADDMQLQALGLITGHSGDWAYGHDFLNASNETNDMAGDDLAYHLTSLLHEYHSL
jgi:hypothetical protein